MIREIENAHSSEIPFHESSNDNVFSQNKNQVSNTFQRTKQKIWHLHLVSPSIRKTLSCNILWQEYEASHSVKRVCTVFFHFL